MFEILGALVFGVIVGFGAGALVAKAWYARFPLESTCSKP